MNTWSHKGGLVSKILQTKKELEGAQDPGEKVQIREKHSVLRDVRLFVFKFRLTLFETLFKYYVKVRIL
jgi:hypothetical protein